ncbi:MAG: hypothetical protein ACI9HK_006126 [Pirellulaceae bacterium]|jgi:hypothetical protein
MLALLPRRLLNKARTRFGDQSIPGCGTSAQYDVVLALLNASDKGLTKDELEKNSKHGDSRKILKRLAEKDSDWNAVISFPGSTGMGYRIL